jgi:hypothetical protein
MPAVSFVHFITWLLVADTKRRSPCSKRARAPHNADTCGCRCRRTDDAPHAPGTLRAKAPASFNLAAGMIAVTGKVVAVIVTAVSPWRPRATATNDTNARAFPPINHALAVDLNRAKTAFA